MQAVNLVRLCERFSCLPEPGGLLDQDSRFGRMLKIEALVREVSPDGG